MSLIIGYCIAARGKGMVFNSIISRFCVIFDDIFLKLFLFSKYHSL